MRVVAHFMRGGVSVCGRGHSGYTDEAECRAAAFSRCNNCIDRLYQESKKAAAAAAPEQEIRARLQAGEAVEVPFGPQHGHLIRVLVSGEDRGQALQPSATCIYETPHWVAYGCEDGGILVVVEKAMSSLLFWFAAGEAYSSWRQRRMAAVADPETGRPQQAPVGAVAAPKQLPLF